jgi:hypothetical protein
LAGRRANRSERVGSGGRSNAIGAAPATIASDSHQFPDTGLTVRGCCEDDAETSISIGEISVESGPVTALCFALVWKREIGVIGTLVNRFHRAGEGPARTDRPVPR